MMKAILLSGLSAVALAVSVAEAQEVSAASPKFNVSSSSRLAELNQSQVFETLSMADGVTRLPASAYQTAGVYFIAGGKGQIFGRVGKDNTFTDNTRKNCARLGFTIQSCASGLFNKACPYNDKIYDKCCDIAYKYSSSQCAAPKRLSSDTCGGKYKCICSTSDFPHSSCNSPKIKGSSCTDANGTRYASCSCPIGIETSYGCKEYYGAPCNTVCKTAYTDNCRNRAAVQTPYGCEKYFDDCDTKCEKAYPDNCRNRNAVSAPYGCQKYYADCQSKCETAYADNCHNRTAVISSCPANASCINFNDCATKIQSWSCHEGYDKSGNICKLRQFSPLPILYGDGTVTKEILSDKTPIGVVFDETNKLAVALTDVKQDGTAGSELMKWSSTNCDTPNLENCAIGMGTEITPLVNECGADGRSNTTVLLSGTCNGTPFAANAVNKYEPSGCAKDFCKKTKWFLSSIRDWTNVYQIKKELVKTLTLLSNFGATTIDKKYYWSSTETNQKVLVNVFLFNIDTRDQNQKSYHKLYVRPVVKY